MKLTAIAAAMLLSVAMPAAVLAQANTPATPDAKANAGAGVNAGGSVGDHAINANTDFNAFLQALQTADFTSATGDAAAASTFTVVKLSSMANADADKLREALGAHQQDIANITTWIDTNAQAKAALDAQGASPDSVVWVGSDSNGGLTLYVNDLEAGGAPTKTN
jgi:hypothetical protein